MPLPFRKPFRRLIKRSLPLLLCAAIVGCNRLERKPANETVYVLAKQTYLRDRVAAVSNRVAMVQNGEKLELLERGRRFLQVKTDKGEIGWIEEHAVVNPDVVTGFQELQKSHAKDPVVGTAVLRDDGYLHLKPGRDTDRFYLLPEGDKLEMLLRASVPKVVGPQASGTTSTYAAKASAATMKKDAAKARYAAQSAGSNSAKETDAAKARDANRPPLPPPPPAPPPEDATSPAQAKSGAPASAAAEPPPPIPMEDWWLVRDSQGKVGWVMSRRLDVDVPDEIAQYAEGQRIVAAYLLRKVDDPESNFPDKQAPEYVTVVNPYQDGLPYDFSQVRVFTWNLRKHRYETAFRQRNLQGYLPVKVEMQTLDNEGPVPTFTLREGVGDSVTIDPDTGAARPTTTETVTYRLDGEQVRKVVPGAPATKPAPPPPGPTRAAGKNAPRGKHRHRK